MTGFNCNMHKFDTNGKTGENNLPGHMTKTAETRSGIGVGYYTRDEGK